MMKNTRILRILFALGICCVLSCSDDGTSSYDGMVDGRADAVAGDGKASDTKQGPRDSGPPPDTTRPDSTCECKAGDGPCCDGCHFHPLSAMQVCKTPVEYKCGATVCGADALKRSGQMYCEGFSAQCGGDVIWSEWSTDAACGADSVCESPDSSLAACKKCDHGCSAGACWPECNPNDGCCNPDGTNCLKGCDPATKQCYPECNATTDKCCDPDGTLCDNGCDEQGVKYPAGTCWPVTCTKNDQCQHGHCVDGVCCNQACSGPCRACNLPGKVGTCTNHGSGSDPEAGCGGFTCNGRGSCNTTCSCSSSINTTCASSACKSDRYCDKLARTCKAKKNNGTVCSNFGTQVARWECRSGQCVSTQYRRVINALGDEEWHIQQAKCCDKDCGRPCQDCATGTCKNTTANTGPVRPPACSGMSCDGRGSCHRSCPNSTTQHCSGQCNSNYWCWKGGCARDMSNGDWSGCIKSCQCQSNKCTYVGIWILCTG